MGLTVSLRSRALTELSYLARGKSSVETNGALDSADGVDSGFQRSKRLREEAARVRAAAGMHLDLAAESMASGDPAQAQTHRELAELAACHYRAYDELAAAAEHRSRARRFPRGMRAREIEIHRAYAAIRRAEGHRERGEEIRRRGDVFAALRHRELAGEAEEKARIADLRAFELMGNGSSEETT
ncbi:hypothetical protein [Amycolatopsis keratiniphila]|uniref:hypothetical protein n=1 Tax=Amycolatopsis keratiniphila TaxID=129921 RepID=UPI000879D985|nr:hypothetical protein [Amycolatopsis keratiniphila]SDU44272.1 hypothetical protein SAMN04489733_4319 [Amycolatopsis keratiniphila]